MKTRRGDEIRGDGEEKRKRANNECGNHTKGRVSGSEGRVERGRIFSILVSLAGCVIRRDAGWRIRWQNKSCLSSHLSQHDWPGLEGVRKWERLAGAHSRARRQDLGQRACLLLCIFGNIHYASNLPLRYPRVRPFKGKYREGRYVSDARREPGALSQLHNQPRGLLIQKLRMCEQERSVSRRQTEVPPVVIYRSVINESSAFVRAGDVSSEDAGAKPPPPRRSDETASAALKEGLLHSLPPPPPPPQPHP